MAAGTAWRWFGSRNSAETLLGAMAGDDEQNRMLAGMSLVKAGQRSFDLIEKMVDEGAASPPVIRLLPDIGGEKSRDVLIRIAESETGELQDAARECIDLLDRIADLR